MFVLIQFLEVRPNWKKGSKVLKKLKRAQTILTLLAIKGILDIMNKLTCRFQSNKMRVHHVWDAVVETKNALSTVTKEGKIVSPSVKSFL